MRPYRDTSQGTRTSGGLRGNLIASRDYKGELWNLKWSDTAKLENLIRLTGPATPDGKSVVPYRYSSDRNDFSEFIINLPLFKGGSAMSMTFIAAFEDPGDPGNWLDTETNPTPAHTFVTAVNRMSRENPQIEAIMRGGRNRRGAGPNIKTYTVAQGVMIQHGERSYTTKPRAPSMFTLSWSAKLSLEEMLNTETPGYSQDPADFESRFVTGDITHADTGKVLSFYNAKTANQTAPGQLTDVQLGNVGRGVSMDPAQNQLAHYVCEVKCVLSLPRDSDGVLTWARQGILFTPWQSALRYLNEEEMAAMIVKAYEDMPDVIISAFRRRPEWIPDYIRGNAIVDMGGGTGPKSSEYHDPRQPAAEYRRPAYPGMTSQAMPLGINLNNVGVGTSGHSSDTPDFVRDMYTDDPDGPEKPMPAQAPAVSQPTAGYPAAATAPRTLQAPPYPGKAAAAPRPQQSRVPIAPVPQRSAPAAGTGHGQVTPSVQSAMSDLEALER